MKTSRTRYQWSALVVLLVAACLLPFTIQSNYTYGVLNLALIYALLTSGFNFTLGFSGRISLGHIGFWALGAYVSAIAMTSLGLDTVLGMLLGIVVSGAVAWVLAKLSNKLSAHYLALATLGFGESMRIVATNWVGLTGGGNGIAGIPPLGIGPLKADTHMSQYFVLLVAVVLGGVFTYRFKGSRLGRETMALRQSEVAAESLGIRVDRLKTLTLVISAVYGSVAGSLYAGVNSYISPDVFAFSVMLTVLAALVIGGQATVLGPIIGGVLLTFLPEWLRIGQGYWQLLYGVALYFIVLKLPGGVIGLVLSGVRRLRGRGGSRDAEQPPEAAASVTGSTRHGTIEMNANADG